MKKNLICRTLAGGPLGLVISTCISIGISYAMGDGKFYPVVPALVDIFGNEINAVAVQTIAAIVYGAVWGGASVIWEIEKWGLLRQTVTHLCIVSAVTFPIAYLLQWMEHSFLGVLSYFGIFLGIYAAIWLSLTISIRRKLKKINRTIQKRP